MAYLNKNADSLADANWSDGTGFANSADLEIRDGSVPVTQGTDHSDLTEGVESFVVRKARQGAVGTPQNPVKFDADASADARVENYAAIDLHYEADGDDSQCNVLRQVGTGSTYVYGGTVSQTYQAAGYFYANESTVLTDIDIQGGRFLIENNATGVNSLNISAGAGVLKRDCDADGTITVKRGVTLTLDIPDASPTLNVTVEAGGRLIVRQANVLASLRNDGLVDLSQAKADSTIGATLHEQGPYGRMIRGTGSHTITAPVLPYGVQDAGGPIEATF